MSALCPTGGCAAKSCLASSSGVRLSKGAALQRGVCWQQEKLEDLERSCGCQEPSTRDSAEANGAQHALQLCNALRRLVLKRLPAPDEELALQVGLRPFHIGPSHCS